MAAPQRCAQERRKSAEHGKFQIRGASSALECGICADVTLLALYPKPEARRLLPVPQILRIRPTVAKVCHCSMTALLRVPGVL